MLLGGSSVSGLVQTCDLRGESPVASPWMSDPLRSQG